MALSFTPPPLKCKLTHQGKKLSHYLFNHFLNVKACLLIQIPFFCSEKLSRIIFFFFFFISRLLLAAWVCEKSTHVKPKQNPMELIESSGCEVVHKLHVTEIMICCFKVMSY